MSDDIRIGARSRHSAWVGAALFLGGFVGNGVLTGAVADRPLPMPDAAPAEVLAYFATQTPAVVVSAICLLVSALGLALFARAVGTIARPDPKRTAAGAVAIAALTAAGLLGLLLAVLGPVGADEAVLVVRSLNFSTGGVIHVVALGAYVATLTLLRPGSRTFGRGVRIFGAVAAVCALLSIASIVLYPASVLLPVGRLLCMLWAVTAGVALARATRGC